MTPSHKSYPYQDPMATMEIPGCYVNHGDASTYVTYLMVCIFLCYVTLPLDDNNHVDTGLPWKLWKYLVALATMEINVMLLQDDTQP